MLASAYQVPKSSCAVPWQWLVGVNLPACCVWPAAPRVPQRVVVYDDVIRTACLGPIGCHAADRTVPAMHARMHACEALSGADLHGSRSADRFFMHQSYTADTTTTNGSEAEALASTTGTYPHTALLCAPV